MPNPQHLLVVSCLVRNPDSAILCIRHKYRGWEIPQGRVEQGESLIAALHREVLEESGVRIAAPRLAAIWSKLSEPTALIHGFVADYAAGTPTPSEETPEVDWLAEAEIRARVEHPVNRDRINDLLAFAGDVTFQSYRTEPYRKIRT